MSKGVGLFIALWLTLLGAGCATKYQPVGFTGGFSDTQIDSNTFRVSFRGNGYTPRETVEDYLMYRCAELTALFEMDYFVIIGGDTERSQTPYTTPGTYSSTTTGSATAYGNTAYGTATTRGTYTPGQTFLINKYGGTATIKVFKGTKPADNPNAFDAHEVMLYLEPKIKRKANR